MRKMREKEKTNLGVLAMHERDKRHDLQAAIDLCLDPLELVSDAPTHGEHVEKAPLPTGLHQRVAPLDRILQSL